MQAFFVFVGALVLMLFLSTGPNEKDECERKGGIYRLSIAAIKNPDIPWPGICVKSYDRSLPAKP